MDLERFLKEYTKFTAVAEEAAKGIKTEKLRCIAFERVLDDLLMRFFDETYNSQKGEK